MIFFNGFQGLPLSNRHAGIIMSDIQSKIIAAAFSGYRQKPGGDSK
jgi:hypothetical protein